MVARKRINMLLESGECESRFHSLKTINLGELENGRKKKINQSKGHMLWGSVVEDRGPQSTSPEVEGSWACRLPINSVAQHEQTTSFLRSLRGLSRSS